MQGEVHNENLNREKVSLTIGKIPDLGQLTLKTSSNYKLLRHRTVPK